MYFIQQVNPLVLDIADCREDNMDVLVYAVCSDCDRSCFPDSRDKGDIRLGTETLFHLPIQCEFMSMAQFCVFKAASFNI